MVVPESLELIATSDDGFPMEEPMNPAENRGNVVLIPISRMGFGTWVMTIALATIATPLICFYSLSSSLVFGNAANSFPWFMKIVPLTIWFVAVFGPIYLYYFMPFGWMNPDHWLLFDRRTDILSLRGGFQRWHRSQIRYLLAITGSKPKSEQVVTELQICIGDAKQFEKELILHTTQRDPEKAYGKTIRVCASAMQVPAYLAKMKANSFEVIQIVGKPND